MLISADIVTPGTGSSKYYLQGQAGYQYGISQLNTISQLYAQGTYADKSKSRSVNVDDINAITGYNPNNTGVYDSTQTGSGTKYNKGSLNEYGNEVKYYWQGTEYPYYSATTNGLTGSLSTSHSSAFYWFDNENNKWTSSSKSSSATTSSKQYITTLTSSYYYYYPNTLGTSSSGSVTGAITTSSKAYDLLFANTSSKYYWLGSSYVITSPSYAYFGVRYVYYGNSYYRSLYSSYGGTYNYDRGVRPVVYLSSDIWVDSGGSTKDGSTQEKAWNLK
jgi:hypothetical protein